MPKFTTIASLTQKDFSKPLPAPRSRKDIIEQMRSKENEMIQKAICDERKPLPPEILADAISDSVHANIGNGKAITIGEHLRGRTKEFIVIDEISSFEERSITDEPSKKKKTNGPMMLPCGHWRWFSDGELLKAKEDGLCCPSGSKEIGKSVVPYYPAITDYIPVIPTKSRRSKENSIHAFCADKNGVYIGGPTNDCSLHQQDNDRRCSYHKKDEVNQPQKEAAINKNK